MPMPEKRARLVLLEGQRKGWYRQSRERERELILTRDRVKEAGRDLGVPESRGLWDRPPEGDKQGVSRSVL